MTSIFDSLEPSLTSLQKAAAAQRAVANVGFEWNTIEDVFEKIQEELQELKVEIAAHEQAKIIMEFGDVMLMLVNLATRLNIDPEAALQQAQEKFIRRFKTVEIYLAAQHKTPATSSLAEMEALWQQIKSEEKKNE